MNRSILWLFLGLIFIESCKIAPFNPKADVRLISISPSIITVTGPPDTAEAEIAVINGIDISIYKYRLDYYNKNDNLLPLSIEYRISYTLIPLKNNTIPDTPTYTSAKLKFAVTTDDVVNYATTNNIEMMKARVKFYGEDINAHQFELEGWLILYF